MTRNVIGRFVVVKFGGKKMNATIIDRVYGTNRPKRVRVQEGPEQGNVLMPHEYELIGFI